MALRSVASSARSAMLRPLRSLRRSDDPNRHIEYVFDGTDPHASRELAQEPPDVPESYLSPEEETLLTSTVFSAYDLNTGDDFVSLEVESVPKSLYRIISIGFLLVGAGTESLTVVLLVKKFGDAKGEAVRSAHMQWFGTLIGVISFSTLVFLCCSIVFARRVLMVWRAGKRWTPRRRALARHASTLIPMGLVSTSSSIAPYAFGLTHRCSWTSVVLDGFFYTRWSALGLILAWLGYMVSLMWHVESRSVRRRAPAAPAPLGGGGGRRWAGGRGWIERAARWRGRRTGASVRQVVDSAPLKAGCPADGDRREGRDPPDDLPPGELEGGARPAPVRLPSTSSSSSDGVSVSRLLIDAPASVRARVHLPLAIYACVFQAVITVRLYYRITLHSGDVANARPVDSDGVGGGSGSTSSAGLLPSSPAAWDGGPGPHLPPASAILHAWGSPAMAAPTAAVSAPPNLECDWGPEVCVPKGPEVWLFYLIPAMLATYVVVYAGIVWVAQRGHANLPYVRYRVTYLYLRVHWWFGSFMAILFLLSVVLLMLVDAHSCWTFIDSLFGVVPLEIYSTMLISVLLVLLSPRPSRAPNVSWVHGFFWTEAEVRKGLERAAGGPPGAAAPPDPSRRAGLPGPSGAQDGGEHAEAGAPAAPKRERPPPRAAGRADDPVVASPGYRMAGVEIPPLGGADLQRALRNVSAFPRDLGDAAAAGLRTVAAAPGDALSSLAGLPRRLVRAGAAQPDLELEDEEEESEASGYALHATREQERSALRRRRAEGHADLAIPTPDGQLAGAPPLPLGSGGAAATPSPTPPADSRAAAHNETEAGAASGAGAAPTGGDGAAPAPAHPPGLHAAPLTSPHLEAVGTGASPQLLLPQPKRLRTVIPVAQTRARISGQRLCLERALRCFSLSRAAYDSQLDAGGALAFARAHWPQVNQAELVADPSHDSRAVAAWGGGLFVVAFRGTATTRNVATDLRVWSVPHAPARWGPIGVHRASLKTLVKVHAGFYAAWNEGGFGRRVLELALAAADSATEAAFKERTRRAAEAAAASRGDEVGPDGAEREGAGKAAPPPSVGTYAGAGGRGGIHARFTPPPPLKIILTGHSLGGALALLASTAIRLTLTRCEVSCYVFGAPKVGNAAYATEQLALSPDTWSLINDQDPVPRVPWGFSFSRPGRRVLLNARGDVILEPTSFDAGAYAVRGGRTAHHRLDSYALSLFAAVRAQFDRDRALPGGAAGALALARALPLQPTLGILNASLRDALFPDPTRRPRPDPRRRSDPARWGSRNRRQDTFRNRAEFARADRERSRMLGVWTGEIGGLARDAEGDGRPGAGAEGARGRAALGEEDLLAGVPGAAPTSGGASTPESPEPSAAAAGDLGASPRVERAPPLSRASAQLGELAARVARGLMQSPEASEALEENAETEAEAQRGQASAAEVAEAGRALSGREPWPRAATVAPPRPSSPPAPVRPAASTAAAAPARIAEEGPSGGLLEVIQRLHRESMMAEEALRLAEKSGGLAGRRSALLRHRSSLLLQPSSEVAPASDAFDQERRALSSPLFEGAPGSRVFRTPTEPVIAEASSEDEAPDAEDAEDALERGEAAQAGAGGALDPAGPTPPTGYLAAPEFPAGRRPRTPARSDAGSRPPSAGGDAPRPDPVTLARSPPPPSPSYFIDLEARLASRNLTRGILGRLGDAGGAAIGGLAQAISGSGQGSSASRGESEASDAPSSTGSLPGAAASAPVPPSAAPQPPHRARRGALGAVVDALSGWTRPW